MSEVQYFIFLTLAFVAFPAFLFGVQLMRMGKVEYAKKSLFIGVIFFLLIFMPYLLDFVTKGILE